MKLFLLDIETLKQLKLFSILEELEPQRIAHNGYGTYHHRDGTEDGF